MRRMRNHPRASRPNPPDQGRRILAKLIWYNTRHEETSGNEERAISIVHMPFQREVNKLLTRGRCNKLLQNRDGVIVRNLWTTTIVPQLVEQLVLVPLGHHVQIINKCKGDPDKFPSDYLFELTTAESQVLRSKISTLEQGGNLRSRISTAKVL